MYGLDYEGTISVKVKVRLTPSDWQLFTATQNCNAAGAALNIAASKALSTGDRKQAWEIFREAQDAWAQYGAADTEPRAVFSELVNRYIGTRVRVGDWD